MRYVGLFSLLLLVASLPACTALELAKLFVPKQPGIAVDAQIGDRENAIESNDVSIDAQDSTVSVQNKDNKVEKAESVVINEGNNWMIMASLVIGILIGWLGFKRPENFWTKRASTK